MPLLSTSAVRWLAAFGLAALLAACGGGSDEVVETPTPGPGIAARTATPFAVLPAATIVTDATTPSGVSEDVTYIVEAGDTLSAIAARFETTVGAIQERNDLAGTDIFVGQQLTIPGDDDSDAAGSTGGNLGGSSGGSGEGDTNPSTYTVQAGDLAGLIAERFSVTLEALAAENELGVEDLNSLLVGQVLNIPPSN
jgi:LysM repeat protein